MFISIMTKISAYAIPLVLAFIVSYAYFIKKISVYEVFIEGAKEGVSIAVKLVPFLVGFLTVTGMLRHSGAIELFTKFIGPFVEPLGIPAEILPLALLRPISSAAATGILGEIFQNHGTESFLGLTASVIINSTDTTFFILAVYFGSVGIRKYRHALAAGLIADFAGVCSALIVCRLLFGSLL